ncbi:T9SS type A sorting domain-containing protein [Flavobacterium sp. RHBU_3]|uniref:Ig-like domain-containing protein n=1 Tax=Flavobacterium sp. RHBU_3 TaxID=3391184 RepID=UPI0039851CAF
MIKMLLLEKRFLAFFLIFAAVCSAQVPYTLTHGFGGPSGLPTGISIVSYDGVTSCVTTSNGGNAVTTLVLQAQPGYSFTVTSVNGTGVRSNSGPTNFNFKVTNNGVATGPVSVVAGSSSCSGGTAISELAVPEANQLVTSGNTITIAVQRAPGSTSGLGYSHAKTLVIAGEVSIAPPFATPATELTTAGFTANWNAVTGATGYRVDVSDTPSFANILEDYDNVAVNGLSLFVHLGIQPNTTYYYRVRTEINEMISANSNVITVVVPACGVVEQPVAAAQMFCGSATVANLVATGAGTIKWYGSETATEALASTASLTTATYYVSQVIANCESEKLPVVVTVNEIPVAPEVAATQYFCGAATANQLVATGTALLWYTDAAGGTAITAETALETGDYYVSQTINGCESPRALTQVTIIPIPAAPVAEAQLFCGSGTVGGLMATGDNLKWYAAEADTTPLADDVALATATYYVSQTVNGCESPKSAVAVTVNEVPELPVAVAQQFCGSGFVSGLVAEGAAVVWYANETDTTPLTVDTALTTATYYATQTIGGCESPRLAVVVTVYDIPAVPTIAPQVFCGEALVSDLAVTEGASPLYYTTLTGGEALSTDTALQTGIYYVSQTVNNCEGARVAFLVIINTVPSAPVAQAQYFCGSATVAELMASGNGIQWYATEADTTPLAADAALATGTYYASQTITACESPKTTVTVTVHEVATAPVVEAQTFCGTTQVSDLIATGEDVMWYATEDAVTPLSPAAAVATGTYYATQTTNGCESPRTAVEVIVNTVPEAPADATVILCGDAVVSDIIVEGDNLQWYAQATGGEALAEDTAIEAGLSLYYVSQTVNGCESARTAIAVTLTTVAQPEGEADQSFVSGETIASLEVTGIAIVWYADADLIMPLTEDTVLEDNTIYYAVSVQGDCESEALAITAHIDLGTDNVNGKLFTLYPNPVRNVMNINAQDNVRRVVVFNLLGQQVLEVAPQTTNAAVDLSALQPAAYLVKVETVSGTRTVKVLKD